MTAEGGSPTETQIANAAPKEAADATAAGVTQFGPYRLERRLGAGGMAEVWRGVHDDGKHPPRPVALKRILPHLCDQLQIVEMFLGEARLAALLKHPNIVRTHDVGILERQPFIAMELVEGVDLRRLMGAAPDKLPLAFALYVATRLCAALDYVHTLKGPKGTPLGLIHRDISHSNVMLTGDGEVKLLDFGVAKAAQSSHLVETQLGELKGKLGYMAPEILREQAYDQRADLFSIGVVLYELLVHDRLFKAATQGSMLMMNMGCLVPPPSLSRREVSPALERVVMRALESQPERRYASAKEMLADLRHLPEARGWSAHDTVRLLAARIRDVKPPAARRGNTRVVTQPRPETLLGARFALAALALALGGAVAARAIAARGPITLAPAPPIVAAVDDGDVTASAALALPLPPVAAPPSAPPTETPPTSVTPAHALKPAHASAAAPAKHPAHRASRPHQSSDVLIDGHELLNPLGR